MQKIQIWEPRYSDDTVLVAKYKVKDDNLIVFTKAKHLKGMEFRVSGETVRKCPLDNNSKIECYAVPMDLLQRVE